MNKLIIMLFLCSLFFLGCSANTNTTTSVPVSEDEQSTVESVEEQSEEAVNANSEEQELAYSEGDGMTTEGPYNGPDGLIIEVPWTDNWYVLKMPNDDNHFKIYYKTTDVESIVYDSAQQQDVEDLDDYRFISQFYVKDANGDGVEELYLFFEDFFEESYVMVLTHPSFFTDSNHYLKTAYFGYGNSIFEYDDIDEDGVMELISPHPGGGGMVTVWRGLDLVNAYDPELQEYVFSYPLTRKKYEDRKEALNRQLNAQNSPEEWEELLESYADLGEPQMCRVMIELGVELTELNIHPDWQGPYDTYFEYVVARAEYYEEIWADLKSKDVETDSEEVSVLSEPFSESDFELSNGLYAEMPYSEFCDVMNYEGTLVFPDDGSGFSGPVATVNFDTLSVSYVWPSSNASDPVLAGYAIEDPTVHTKRGAGIGMAAKELIERYGEPVSRSDGGVMYQWKQYALFFELAGDKVSKYRMTVNP